MFRVKFLSKVMEESREWQLYSMIQTAESCSVPSLLIDVFDQCENRQEKLKGQFGGKLRVVPEILFDTLECVRKGDPGEIDLLKDSYEEMER